MGANMGKTNGGSLLENLTLPSTHPTLHIVMLGLDSAGKTTALYRLKFDQYVNTVCSFFFRKKKSYYYHYYSYILNKTFSQVPTIGFNCEKIRALSGKAKGTQFLVWDVGKEKHFRVI